MFSRFARILCVLVALTILARGWRVVLSALPARQPVAKPSLTREPYIQMPAPTTVVIAWKTNLASHGVVEYGPVDSPEAQIARQEEVSLNHTVTLAGLLPDTVYRYRVLADDLPLGVEAAFRTPPSASTATTFSFAALGDSGVGAKAQFEVADRLAALAPDFVLHTGDVIYPGGEATLYDPRFFKPYRETLRRAPFFPSLGNHDAVTANGAPYLQTFHLPANSSPGKGRYYSFDWGNAHFIALDPVTSPFKPGSAQYAWLEQDLATTRATWKFVFFHYPPYSSGPHGSNLAVRAAWSPLFERYGVDIVFNGHDHDYERSVPIHDYVPNSQGVIYVVTGGGGSTLYPVGKSRWTAYADAIHHLVHVVISGNTLTLRAVRPDETVFDSLTLTHGEVAPTPIPTSTSGSSAVQVADPCRGSDIPPSGQIDLAYLNRVIAKWGSTQADDFDGDGLITARDVQIVAVHLGESCSDP